MVEIALDYDPAANPDYRRASYLESSECKTRLSPLSRGSANFAWLSEHAVAVGSKGCVRRFWEQKKIEIIPCMVRELLRTAWRFSCTSGPRP